eukprot:TRINITY_DN11289_c0_g1_i1.p2 TRINITY_DN11289_c0_g1~~TRINITY_DN11289_c0_g1_i1.p2  ORF type:complete len:108 (+),score=4.48 TRINITY_DN11289_c0_g1_i1:174-497(+)
MCRCSDLLRLHARASRNCMFHKLHGACRHQFLKERRAISDAGSHVASISTVSVCAYHGFSRANCAWLQQCLVPLVLLCHMLPSSANMSSSTRCALGVLTQAADVAGH